jgi:hypothetical protein
LKVTREESAIITAFTGVLSGPFDAFHAYVEKIMGRPLLTHELADQEMAAQIKEKSRADFVALAESVSNNL